jgi:hypothetical protein
LVKDLGTKDTAIFLFVGILGWPNESMRRITNFLDPATIEEINTVDENIPTKL